MPLIVRRGDSSTHGGTVVTSAERWRCEGALIARLTDKLLCPIHGLQPIVEASSLWKCEGLPIARHDDAVACGATLISGASKWICD